MDKLDAEIESTLQKNPRLKQLFEEHPEKKAEYKNKLIDAGFGREEEPITTEKCKVCQNCIYKDDDGYDKPFCQMYQGEVGKPNTYKPMTVRYEEGYCDYFRSIGSLFGNE